MTTFYYTIKPALKESPLVEFNVTPERIIEVKLTPQGREIAKSPKNNKTNTTRSRVPLIFK